MSSNNLTSWLLEAGKLNILSTLQFFEDKLQEINYLVKSGLPTYDYSIIALGDFYTNPTNIETIYRQFDNSVVVRAISTNSRYKRITHIDKTYRYTKTEFQKNISPETEKYYKVVINSYDPAEYCGVIISSSKRLIIEMIAEDNLENLCHGHVIPWHGEFSDFTKYSFRKMVFREDVPVSMRKIMWNILLRISAHKVITGNIPEYIPQTGDFEFVISKKDGCLRFIDYKHFAWKFDLYNQNKKFRLIYNPLLPSLLSLAMP